jgi:hypothetical protein
MDRLAVMVLTLSASLLVPTYSHAFVSNQHPSKSNAPNAASCGGHYSSERCPDKNKIKPNLESANLQREQLRRAKPVSNNIIGVR